MLRKDRTRTVLGSGGDDVQSRRYKRLRAPQPQHFSRKINFIRVLIVSVASRLRTLATKFTDQLRRLVHQYDYRCAHQSRCRCAECWDGYETVEVIAHSPDPLV